MSEAYTYQNTILERSTHQLREDIDYLSRFINQDRVDRILEVLTARTRHLTVVLEDIHKAHNANAVLRSCEGFGVQDVHIIENTNRFESSSTISLGAHKWLTLSKYSTHDSNVKECFNQLHNQGYTIIATSPHYNSREISDLEVDDKTALVFGTELDGVSEEVIAQCDGFVKIPMVGFVESYNLSVSAAICLHTLSAKLRKKAHDSWCLSDKEKLQLQVEWMLKSTKNGRRIWERYLREQG